MRALLFTFLLAGCTVNVPTFSSEIDGGGDDDAPTIDASIDSSTIDAETDAPTFDYWCLRGTIQVTNAFDTVNGNPSTMFFEHLEGDQPSDYNLVFTVNNSFLTTGTASDPPEGQLRVLDVAIMSFSFADQEMNDRFGVEFTGLSYGEITLVNGPVRGVYMGNMVSPTQAEYWGWEAYTTQSGVVTAQDGYPELTPTTGPGSGNLTLRRYQNVTPIMTDYAQTTWTVGLYYGNDCL